MFSKQQSLKSPTAAFVAPFAAFVAIMALERAIGLPAGPFYAVRAFVVLGVLLAVSRPVIDLRVSAPWGSAAVGAAVFLIWIAPDVLFGPGYRHHWIFDNALTGSAVTSAPEELRRNAPFIVLRAVGCTMLVPILEELFWRGWLMRWLVSHDFLKVSIGTYFPSAFWAVAILFGSEHGPYWEVGLLAGIAYNWWCVRTKRLGDCIAAHSVTNGLLSVYVLVTGSWQYWL
jgi:CAAX prenyl protease-like protein